MDHNPSFSTPPESRNGQQQAQAPTQKIPIGEVVQSAKQVAGDLADRARRAAEQRIDEARHMAADRIGSVADAMRITGDQLHAQDVAALGVYADQAVDRLDAASQYLESHSLSELVADVEGFARREPAIFLGGAFLLGLIGGRFLKSSGKPRAGIESSGELEGGESRGQRGERSLGEGDKPFVPGGV